MGLAAADAGLRYRAAAAAFVPGSMSGVPGDITALIAALGVSPAAFWDRRVAVAQSAGIVSSVGDARGPGVGVGALSGGGGATFSGGYLQFNGSSQYLVSPSSTTIWGSLSSQGVTVAVIAGLASTSGGALFCTLNPTGTHGNAGYVTIASSGSAIENFGVVSPVAVGSTIRTVLSSRTSAMSALQVINQARGTFANAKTITGAGTFSLGASDTGSAFTTITNWAATLILPGDFSSAQAAALASWAETVHGAVAA